MRPKNLTSLPEIPDPSLDWRTYLSDITLASQLILKSLIDIFPLVCDIE